VLDELQIHQVPVLFGGGRRLFEVLPARIELEIIRVIDTPRPHTSATAFVAEAHRSPGGLSAAITSVSVPDPLAQLGAPARPAASGAVEDVAQAGCRSAERRGL
jgi:hypothetical protein